MSFVAVVNASVCLARSCSGRCRVYRGSTRACRLPTTLLLRYRGKLCVKARKLESSLKQAHYFFVAGSVSSFISVCTCMRACIRKNDEQVVTEIRTHFDLRPASRRSLFCRITPPAIRHTPTSTTNPGKKTPGRGDQAQRGGMSKKRYASVFGCTSKNENNVDEACADQTDRTPCLVADLLLLLLHPTSHQHQLQHRYRYRVRNKRCLLRHDSICSRHG